MNTIDEKFLDACNHRFDEMFEKQMIEQLGSKDPISEGVYVKYVSTLREFMWKAFLDGVDFGLEKAANVIKF